MEMALEEEAWGTRMRMELCCGRIVMGCGRKGISGYVQVGGLGGAELVTD